LALFGELNQPESKNGPSSLLPDDPLAAIRQRREAENVRVSPSSLLPEDSVAAIRQRRETENVRVSPSSLLEEDPAPVIYLHPETDIIRESPSSLLGDSATPDVYHDEERVSATVSPTTLLPSPPRFHRPWKIYLASAVALLVVSAFALGLTAYEPPKPTEQIMAEARALQASGHNVSAAILLKTVVRREPENIEAHLSLGKAYVDTGALLDAEKALQRAQELGASASEALPLLADVLINLDRHEEALKRLSDDKLLAKLPGPSTAILRGRAFLGLGNLVEARTQFTIARAALPGPAMAGLARTMMFDGDPDGALKILNVVAATYPNTVEAWITKGDLMRGMGRGDDAMVAYRRAEELAPSSMEAILGSAIVLIGKEEMVEAHKQLRKARSIAPASHLLGYANAVLALKEKRYSDARDELRIVLATAPSHMPSVLLAGAVNYASGHLGHAQAALVRYIHRFPGSVDARKMYAAVLLRKNQPQSGVDVVAPFIDLDIRNAQFFAVAGQAYLQVGQTATGVRLLLKAAQLDPGNAAALTQLGLANIATGARDRGIVDLQKAVALNPKDARADRHLAMALIARIQFDEALAVADNLEQRLPNNADAPWLRGIVYAVRKDTDRAKENFERALQLQPAFFPAVAQLVRLDVREGNKLRARQRLDSFLKLDPSSLDARLALANLEAQSGNLEHAISRAQRAAADHPHALAALLTVARLLRQAGKLDDALITAARARDVDPKSPQAAELLGQTQLASGNSSGAVLNFTVLVNMRPRYLPGHIQLARAEWAAGDRRAANASLRKVLARAPASEEALSLLGSLLIEQKAYEQALEVAAQAKMRLPVRALGHVLEGEISLARKENKRAVAAFTRANELRPSGPLLLRVHQAQSAELGRDAPIEPLIEWIQRSPQDAIVRFYVADALVRLGRAKEAVPLYLEVLKRSPQDHRALNNLADALMRLQDPRALDYAQQAFNLRPDDAVPAATLGSVLLSRGKFFEAVQVLQKATQLDPSNAEIRYQFVLALAKAGDRGRARSELQALLASGSTFAQIAEARSLVGEI